MLGFIKDTFARKAKGSVDARMDILRAEILADGFLVDRLEHYLCEEGVRIVFTISHRDGRRAVTRKEGILIRNKQSQAHAANVQARNRTEHLRLAQSLRDGKRSIPTPAGWE